MIKIVCIKDAGTKFVDLIKWHNQLNPMLVWNRKNPAKTVRVESSLNYEPTNDEEMIRFSGLIDLADRLGIDDNPLTLRLSMKDLVGLLKG